MLFLSDLKTDARKSHLPILPLDGLAAPARSESEKLELLQLQQGETVFLKVRKILMKDIFSTFDSIPRAHATINTTHFYTPKVKDLTAKNEATLKIWLSWLSILI